MRKLFYLKKSFVFQNAILALITAAAFVLLGSMGTDKRWGGIHKSVFMRNSFLGVTMKKWLKSVIICWRYGKNKSGVRFFEPLCNKHCSYASIFVTTLPVLLRKITQLKQQKSKRWYYLSAHWVYDNKCKKLQLIHTVNGDGSTTTKIIKRQC